MARLKSELWVYLRHVAALFWPNAKAPALDSDPTQPGDISTWSEPELDLLIEEGRRQIDRQHEDLERIRTRAQVLIAFGLALEASIASFYDRVTESPDCLVWFVWGLSIATGAWSILGAAATSVVRADMEMIHTAVLTRKTSPKRDLAEDYGAMMKAGEDQLSTRLTNLRHAVVWLLLSSALGLASWLMVG